MLPDLQGYESLLWTGVQLTIVVALCSMVLAVALGLAGALAKISGSKVLRFLARTYTTVIRGVPELVLILLVYYGVPTLIQDITTAMGGEIYVDLDPFTAGSATIGFIYGAFCTEVFRGAYMAVPPGQLEAARAVGMGRALAFRRVLLPQMWRFALPGLGNVWLVLLKATALISVIQLPELMFNSNVAARATRMPFTFFFLASLIYLVITLVSMFAQKKLEQRANRGVRRA